MQPSLSLQSGLRVVANSIHVPKDVVVSAKIDNADQLSNIPLHKASGVTTEEMESPNSVMSG